MFFLAYFFVLFLLFVATYQILILADKKRFKEFELEKFARVMVGPKLGSLIETLLFFANISCYIAGILFTGFFISKFFAL